MGEDYFGCIRLPFRKQSERRVDHLETISVLAEHSDRNLSVTTESVIVLQPLPGRVKPSREVV